MWLRRLITSRIMKLSKQQWTWEYLQYLLQHGFREYRNSDTVVEMNDVVTPDIRRTRSVPQGDPSAAHLFGAARNRPAGKFVEVSGK